MLVKTNLKNYQVDVDSAGNYIPQKVYIVPEINEKTGDPNVTAGKEIVENLGYCSSMTSALKRVAKDNLHSVGGDISLEDYVHRLEKIHEQLFLGE